MCISIPLGSTFGHPRPPCHIDIPSTRTIPPALHDQIPSQECRSLPQHCSMHYIRITLRVSLTSWMRQPAWSSMLGLMQTFRDRMVTIMAEQSIRTWLLGLGSMPDEEQRMAVLFYGECPLVIEYSQFHAMLTDLQRNSPIHAIRLRAIPISATIVHTRYGLHGSSSTSTVPFGCDLFQPLVFSLFRSRCLLYPHTARKRGGILLLALHLRHQHP